MTTPTNPTPSPAILSELDQLSLARRASLEAHVCTLLDLASTLEAAYKLNQTESDQITLICQHLASATFGLWRLIATVYPKKEQ